MEIVHAVENWIEQHAAEMADFKSEIPELTEAEKQAVARKVKMAELAEIENILASRDMFHGGKPIPDEDATKVEQLMGVIKEITYVDTTDKANKNPRR